MAISVDWVTRVITIPQADLTLLSGSLYELDVNAFRLALKDLEDLEGMPFDDTHNHNTEVIIGGVTYARLIEIINGYTVTFEDGQYAVNIVGGNTNLAEVLNINQVSTRSNNSAGLISGGRIVSGLDTIIDLLCNNGTIVNNPDTSRTVTIFEDDGITIRARVHISPDGLTRTRLI